MGVIKKILANVAQALSDSEKSQARSNIGISPIYRRPTMSNTTKSWTNKSYGDEWKQIDTTGIQQSLSITGGKPAIVVTELIVSASGITSTIPLHVKIATSSSKILDEYFVDVPLSSNSTIVPLLFMSASPQGDSSYNLYVSVSNALSNSQTVTVSGPSTGVVRCIQPW